LIMAFDHKILGYLVIFQAMEMLTIVAHMSTW